MPRFWTTTINYFTNLDIDELMAVINKPSVDYYAWCLEGCAYHHEHIHLSVHFKSDVPLLTYKKYWTKQHHHEEVKNGRLMHEYIRGYKNKQIKCHSCQIVEEPVMDWYEMVNIYCTEGTIPENGIKKTAPQSQKIMSAIEEGKTVSQLDQLFSSYMMYHKDKVIRWINDHKPPVETKYYVYIPLFDALTECIDLLELKTPAYVTDLDQIELYSDYDSVIFNPDNIDKYPNVNMWPRGVPIGYKYGYQYKTIKTPIFILVVNERKFYTSYKNLANI